MSQPADPTQLRDRLAEALREAPVRGTVMRMTVLTELYGPVDALTTAVLAVVQPLLDQAAIVAEANNLHRAMLEEARDLFTAAGINRAHGDDWPDIIPALQEVITERDEARQQLAAAGLAPVPQPPGATELLCSAVLFRTFGGTGGHHSHAWEPQPGMVPVWCPGNTTPKEQSCP